MDLISIILIIVFISKIVKKSDKTSNKTSKTEKAAETIQNLWEQMAEQTQGRFYNSGYGEGRSKQSEAMNAEKAVKDQIERTKQRILESRGMSGKENKSAMQQVHEGRMEAQKTSILERASRNADANKEDVTLTTMEAEHNHSERVPAAVHDHPEDVIPENMLGTIEDLMIKGYDGSLCFERDFLGEAMDMIGRFTVPSDVPDFANHDAV